MKAHCISNLEEIKSLLFLLDSTAYKKSSSFLSGATIGQHVRHILEFYKCLLEGHNMRIVNYDARARNTEFEHSIPAAIQEINSIIEQLTIVGNQNTQMLLTGNFSSNPNDMVEIESSYSRELAYCLEHSIHHQALIKISLLEQGLSNRIEANFGVAPATIRYSQICVQ